MKLNPKSRIIVDENDANDIMGNKRDVTLSYWPLDEVKFVVKDVYDFDVKVIGSDIWIKFRDCLYEFKDVVNSIGRIENTSLFKFEASTGKPLPIPESEYAPVCVLLVLISTFFENFKDNAVAYFLKDCSKLCWLVNGKESKRSGYVRYKDKSVVSGMSDDVKAYLIHRN